MRWQGSGDSTSLDSGTLTTGALSFAVGQSCGATKLESYWLPITDLRPSYHLQGGCASVPVALLHAPWNGSTRHASHLGVRSITGIRGMDALDPPGAGYKWWRRWGNVAQITMHLVCARRWTPAATRPRETEKKEEPPFFCTHADCGRQFQRKTSLTNHLKAHNNKNSRSILRSKRRRDAAIAKQLHARRADQPYRKSSSLTVSQTSKTWPKLPTAAPDTAPPMEATAPPREPLLPPPDDTPLSGDSPPGTPPPPPEALSPSPDMTPPPPDPLPPSPEPVQWDVTDEVFAGELSGATIWQPSLDFGWLCEAGAEVDVFLAPFAFVPTD